MSDPPTVRRPPSPRLALVAPLLASALGCAAGGEGKGAKGRPPPQVVVEKAAAREVAVEVRAPVDLRPLAQADLGSKTLGYLDAVLVDRGDRVERGQLVALVRPSDLPDQLAAARGNLAQARANLDQARSSFERAKQLAPSGVVAQQDLERAAATLAAAEAAAGSLRAQIDGLATRLGETRITSPMDGVVWQRRLDPGALVGQPGGGVILTVAQVDTLRLFLAVNERYAGQLRLGQEAFVDLDALPGRRFAGKVTRLAPGYETATRTLEAEVRIRNPEGLLRPGMYGRGAVVLERHPGAVVVPVAAVQLVGERSFVFVVEGDVARRRQVGLGFDGGSWLEVSRGLAAGEEVVIAGADGLADGAKVRVVRDLDPYTGARREGRSGDDGGPRPDGGGATARP